MNAEVLERLKAVPPTTQTKLYSWPFISTDESYEEGFAELCRIFGNAPYDWGASEEIRQAQLDRATACDVPLFIKMSPIVPQEPICCLKKIKRRTGKQWGEVWDHIGSTRVAHVLIDLEGFRYSNNFPRGPDDIRRDKLVAEYNTFLYESIAGSHFVTRYGHMMLSSLDGRNIRRQQYTNHQDLSDGGFNTTLYGSTSPSEMWEILNAQVEYADLWGVNEGSVWVSPGVTNALDDCSAELLGATEIRSSNSYSVPYDPRTSWNYGAWIGRPGFSAEEYACWKKLRTVYFWPPPGHPDSVKTSWVHTLAFLEGLLQAGTGPYDTRLTELQREIWNVPD